MINDNYNYESLRSRLVSYSNCNKFHKNFESSRQEDLLHITFGELVPEGKIRENNSENMIVLQNDVRRASRCVKILMDSGASASIIHDSFLRTNKLNVTKTSVNKWFTMTGSFLMWYEHKVNIILPEHNMTEHSLTLFHITIKNVITM